jgi:hypothetical protein
MKLQSMFVPNNPPKQPRAKPWSRPARSEKGHYDDICRQRENCKILHRRSLRRKSLMIS